MAADALQKIADLRRPRRRSAMSNPYDKIWQEDSSLKGLVLIVVVMGAMSAGAAFARAIPLPWPAAIIGLGMFAIGLVMGIRKRHAKRAGLPYVH